MVAYVHEHDHTKLNQYSLDQLNKTSTRETKLSSHKVLKLNTNINSINRHDKNISKTAEITTQIFVNDSIHKKENTN